LKYQRLSDIFLAFGGALERDTATRRPDFYDESSQEKQPK
jgi:hypothetical protein